MAEPPLLMQSQTRPVEGLALTWEAVPGVIRYGLVIGYAGLPAPTLATIMRGGDPSFALVGVPKQYTGAFDRVSPVGEDRQYGLVAYCADASLVIVADVRFSTADSAPGDRDYYALPAPTLGPPPPKVARPDVAIPPAPPVERSQPALSGPQPSPEMSVGATPTPVDSTRPQQQDGETEPHTSPRDTPISAPGQPAAGPRVVASWAPIEQQDVRPPVDADLSELLDEAELSLLPAWADYPAATRLLARAVEIAPEEPRVFDLKSKLRRVQEGDTTFDAGTLQRDAHRALQQKDYWRAVDLYEAVLARDPGRAEARDGAARARLLARWSVEMAGGDADRLARIGDELAVAAPDLSVQAYDASFHARPTVRILRVWLLALVHNGLLPDVPVAARDGVGILRQGGRVIADQAQDGALTALEEAGQPTAEHVERLIDTLTAPRVETGT